MSGRVNVAAGFRTQAWQHHDLRERQPLAQSQRDRHAQRRAQSEFGFLDKIARKPEAAWPEAPAEAPAATVMTAAMPAPPTPSLAPARRRCSEPHPQFPGMTRGAVLDRQMARASLYAAATERRASAMAA